VVKASKDSSLLFSSTECRASTTEVHLNSKIRLWVVWANVTLARCYYPHIYCETGIKQGSERDTLLLSLQP
jgi:hypothetical protein